jgi:hypothetical protein
MTSARDFHARCDGHAPTLTLIQDTDGNIFSGFTPVEWESWNGKETDPGVRSFPFALKNLHNFPARKFALKAERKDKAIYCDSEKDKAINCDSSWGPFFEDIGNRFPMAATQTPTVAVALACFTRTIRAWTGKLFSRVRSISL